MDIPKRDSLPRVQDEVDELRAAEIMLKRSIPGLAVDTEKRRARADRMEYWMRPPKESEPRPWWQFWKR